MLPVVANPDTGRVDPSRLLQAARCAEQTGFDAVYVGDHLLHPHPLLEALVTLGAVAAVTERVTLGTCVLLLALRDPVWVAKQLGTLSHFAPGRLRVGIGLGGEYPEEFAAADVALAERGHITEAMLREVRGLLAGNPVEVTVQVAASGRIPVCLAPLPIEPISYFFGGWKRTALARAAAMADGWIGYLLSPDGFGRRCAFLLETRAALRLGPFHTGMLLPVHLDSDSEGAQRRAASAWGRIIQNDAALPEQAFAAGPALQIVNQIRDYWRAGCTEIVLSLVDQGDSYLAQLDVLAESILPQIRTFATSAATT